MPPGLTALEKHDKEKGTDFVPLLRLYLDCERSAVATARAAYRSRSTLLYQLDRMQEILDIDLNDPEQRLIVQIALRLRDECSST